MEQLHCRAAFAYEDIYITTGGIQPCFSYVAAHSIHSKTHVYRVLRHNYTVVLIQTKHCFSFLRTKVYSIFYMQKSADFGWLRLCRH